ncbi:MAG: hypothetical protein ABIB97_00920 [Patescibacteria group bacterium]
MSLETTKLTVKIIKVVIYLIPIGILLFLLNKNFVPLGTLEIKYQAELNENQAIENFASREGDKIIGYAETTGDYFHLITTDPVLFDLRAPRLFPTAKISVLYQDPDWQPLLRIGVRQKNGQYHTQTAAHHDRIIENLPDDWQVTKEGAGYLAQKTEGLDTGFKKFDSVEQLKADQPSIEKILTINHHLVNDLAIPEYQKSGSFFTIDNSLRGPIEIYTYVQHEDLDFTFHFQDINRHQGADKVPIVVYKEAEIVYSSLLEDDGDDTVSGVASAVRPVSVKIVDPEPGIYRLVVGAINDEIFTRQIITSQSKVVFKNNLFLAESDEYASSFDDIQTKEVVVYTDSPSFRLTTPHQKGLQTITAGDQTVDIEETHIEYPVVNPGQNLIALNSPINDVKIIGSGFYAFSPESFFDPTDYQIRAKSVSSLNSLDDLADYDYIIGEYIEPQRQGNWLVAEAQVEVPQLYFDENFRASFSIDLPGLAENNRLFKIKEIQIVLEKPPLTFSNIFSRAKDYFTNLF